MPGRLPRTRLGLVDWKAARRRSVETMARLGFDVDPDARLDSLSVAQRQMVEIASALSRNARLVILDEPSAVLGGAELEKLFGVIRHLAAEGVSFIYISHRLQEVFRICDRVTVLRDGALVGTRAVGEVDPPALIRMMVGRQLADIYPARQRRPGKQMLKVRGLSRPGVLHDIDLDIFAGEILGICGMAGSGRTELLRALIGADPSACALIRARRRQTRGRPIRARRSPPASCCCRKTARPRAASCRKASPSTSPSRGWPPSAATGCSTRPASAASSSPWCASSACAPLRPDTPIRNLSGGNQQKCLIARSLNAGCAMLLIDEPTRGVDVGAKREIYQLLASLADEQGAAIVIVSSELPEILGLCDRIVVMRDGRVAGRFGREEATEEVLLAAAVGGGAESGLAA